jgi:hypothetical protein
LKEVFRARDGQVLDPDQVIRAEALAEGFKRNKPPGDSFVEAGSSFRVAQKELKALESNVNAAYLLACRLDPKATGSAALANRLFPDGVIPPQVQELILASRKVTGGGEWNRQEANQILQNSLKQRMEGINELRRAQYDEYMAGLHEKEAWYVGERARIKAKEAGAVERQPAKKQSLADQLEGLFPEGFGDDVDVALEPQW